MTGRRLRPHNRNGFKIAIICALPLEAEMVQSIFNEVWDDTDKSYGKAAGDQNAYTTGAIGSHDVVLAHMPGMGGNKAATVAQGLRSSYRQVELAFVVGICGAVPVHPQTKEEIVLGDCLISTAVVQYDFGRQYPHGFVMKNNIENSLERANLEISSLMAKLTTRPNMERLSERLVHHVAELQKVRQDVRYPGTQRDRLFPSSYIHQCRLGLTSGDIPASSTPSLGDCNTFGCEDDQLIPRDRLRMYETVPRETGFFPSKIHFGRFGSANTVMKSGLDRDRVAREGNLTAFEMEGSGVWDSFPTVVIKSACDYADSHKTKEWQLYAAATAAAGLKAFLERWEVADESCSHGNNYNIPFSIQGVPVTKLFVERPLEMQSLRNTLLPDTNITRRKISVLRGLGGIGKTQLAVEFMRSQRAEFSAVFWLDGSSEETLRRSVARCASRISLDQISHTSREYARSGEGDIGNVVQEVLDWFARPDNNRWLIIFDNVDREFTPSRSDPLSYDLDTYIPPIDHGSILITTRLARLEQLGDSQEIKKVDNRTAQAILRSWYKNAYDEVEGKELLQYLDGLPLAIAQAGAYLQESGMSLTSYLQLYQERRADVAELLHGSSASVRDYPGRSVWTTWVISYDAILARDRHVANLLIFWSFLDRHDLWFGIFGEAVSQNSTAQRVFELLGNIPTQHLSFVNAMTVLRNYSLIEGSDCNDGYMMHAVVHRWAYLYQGLQRQPELGTLALTVVGWAIPMSDEREYAQLQRRLLPHAQALIESVGLSQSSGINSFLTHLVDHELVEDVLVAFHMLGLLYADQDKHVEAEKMYRLALDNKEKVLGPEHTSSLYTVHNLGMLYRSLGRHAEAEKMFMRALEGYEEALGPEHPTTLKAVNNLGNLYWVQGKLAEAEKMYKRALEDKEKTLGPEHNSTLDSVHNLGVLCKSQGKDAQAEKMYLRALQGYEKALGLGHPTTLKAVNNLGDLFSVQGKHVEAEKMHMRALHGYEKALGPEHTSTLATLNTLGNLFTDQGKHVEAEKMYTRALYGYEQVLDPELIKTYIPALNTMWNLGDLFSKKQPYEAQAMYKKALSGYTINFGESSDACLHLERCLDALDISSQQDAANVEPDVKPVDEDSSATDRPQKRERVTKKWMRKFRT